MYKNTITSQLWECFDEITNLKISELMNEWVNFSGHPLLTIDIIKKEDKYFFKLEQNSMLKDDNTIWKLPVFIKSKNFEICRLITTKNYEISFEELNLDYNEIEKEENFVVFNSDLKGFYRVKYNNEILLNSILANFKKSGGEDNEKIKSVNDFDIFGILSYEKYCNNFENIKK
jgi:tricorn protease interacting factor F2/3